MAIILALGVAAPLPAQEAQPPGPVATLSLALRLYIKAEADGDPLGMATAARLAQGIDLRTPSGWTSAQAALDRPEGAGMTITPAAMPAATLDTLLSGAAMAGAMLMAEEDEALADLLSDLAPPRRRAGGADRIASELPPARREVWTLPLSGQSPAGIAVLADGPGALVWRVEDAGGQGICAPVPAYDLRPCGFVPPRNGFYKVVIENPGGSDARYILLAN